MKDKNDIFYGLDSLNIDDIAVHISARLYTSNYTVNEIASTLGLSEKTIYRNLNKSNVLRKKKKS